MRDPALQFLARALAPHRKTVGWFAILAVVAAVIDVVIPVLYGRALDAVIAQRPLSTLAVLLGVWLVLRSTADWLRRTITYRGFTVAHRIAMAFTFESFQHYIALPLAFHHEYRSGDIRERASRLRIGLENVINRTVFDLVPGLLILCFVIAYLFWLDPLLGLADVVVVAMFIAHSVRMVPRFDAAWDAHHALERKLYGRMGDAAQNVAVVKANTTEEFESNAVHELTDATHTTNAAKLALFRQSAAAHDGIFGTGTVLLFGIAAFRAHQGALTPGTIASVLGYVFLTWHTVYQFVWQWWEFVAFRAYRKSYAEVGDAPEERSGVGRTIALDGAIAFDCVRFRYREGILVLEDVSFTIGAGQTVALVGESGEGKTTIVELLARYYEPQSGEIRIDGIPLRDIELRCLRSQLAYVPQDLMLFHDSIRQNIRYGRLDATDAEVEDAARRASLHKWIAGLPEGYTSVVGERGMKVSAGQRQRIAIARAFLRNPRILILDEPTSSLDAATEDEIQRSMRVLMEGRTTIVIAHRLRTVRDADQIFVLKGGRIAESGTHIELMVRSGEYRRLHDLQFAEAPAEDA